MRQLSARKVVILMFLVCGGFFAGIAAANTPVFVGDVTYSQNANSRAGAKLYRYGSAPVNGGGRNSIPILYVTGFELSERDITNPGSGPAFGTAGSANEVYNALNITAHGNSFLDWLVSSKGYTVYVLDLDDTEADVRVNAILLESALTDPNLELRQYYSKTGIRAAVAGWSMGGLIARYALTDMEYRQVDHGVDLYISIDSPHRGAYMPTVAEVLVRSLDDFINESSEIPLTSLNGKTYSASAKDIPDAAIEPITALVSKLDSVAAEQLLGKYIKTGSMSFNFVAGNTWDLESRLAQMTAGKAAHPSYYQLRDQLLLRGGYPERTRNVGVAHGSMFGTRLAPVNDGLALNLTTQLWSNNGRLPGNTDVKVASFSFWHDSSTRHQKLCSFKFGGSGLLIPDLPSYSCPTARMPSHLDGVDVSPGSPMKLLGEVDRLFEHQDDILLRGGTTKFMLKFSTADQISPSTSFIPTLSALDIPINDWDSPANALANLSPFDVIIGNTGNAEHNLVTKSIADKLVIEIDSVINARTAERSIIPSLL